MSKIVWKNWNPDKVIEKIASDAAENMEIACKFVETEARRRLLAISEPEWGAAYRREILARRLTSVVKRKSKAVVGIVGMMKGKEGSYYGYYIEMGSKTAPPQPYLRPAIFHNAREIVQLLAGK